jgi:uncharacterized protein
MSQAKEFIIEGQSLRALGWRIIDAHAHLGSYGAFDIPHGDADGMVRQMDDLGIDVACISSLMAINADYVRGNDLTAAAVRRHPHRFVGYAVANPWETDRITDELTRAFDELGLSAIKIHPTLWELPVDDARYDPIWAFASERKALVLSHTWAGERTCRPSLFRTIAHRYPEVAFLLGHSGGSRAGNLAAIEVARACPNIYLETCYSRLTRDQFELLVHEAGSDRVVFGTDMPFIDAAFTLAQVAGSDLPVAQRKAILGENAARLLATYAPGATALA